MRATMNKSKIVSGFKRLMSNERGNMAIVVGMATVPMMLIMGAAVDFENASNTHTELQSSVDSAALYAASLTDMTNDALTTKSKPYFNANFNSSAAPGTASAATYAVTSVGDSITATASIPVNNAFMKLAGLPTTTVSATSVVKKAGINLEVSLVLDNTGSMGSTNAKTGNTAIYDLKIAAAKFVDQVMPATQGQFYTKIAAIPYNSSVNLGTSALAVQARGSVLSGTSTTPGYQNYTFSSNKRESYSNGSWQNNCTHDSNHYCLTTAAITNCVTERTGTAAYTDASVGTYPVGRKYVVTNSSFNPCTVTPMVPLSTDAATLKSTIGAMSSGNWTAGQTGLAWGWYALSPSIGVFTGAAAPAGYDKLTTTDLTQKVRKVMILMTDAEYNTAYVNGVVSSNTNYTSYGSGNDDEVAAASPTNGDVYTQAASMCSGIKASGVEVYVITFQLDKSLSWRVGLVNNCATDSSHIIDADSTSLDAAFGKIANQILAMRIAQ